MGADGGRGAGDAIPPNATLEFDCELVAVGGAAQSLAVGGVFGAVISLFNKITGR